MYLFQNDCSRFWGTSLSFFSKTIITLVLVGYELDITNSALLPGWLSTISYPTRAQWTIVIKYMLWFGFILGSKFNSPLFQPDYHIYYGLTIHYHTQKQSKIKFEPRIKLNHNIYTRVKRSTYMRVKCLVQEYNSVPQSGFESGPSKLKQYAQQKLMLY